MKYTVTFRLDEDNPHDVLLGISAIYGYDSIQDLLDQEPERRVTVRTGRQSKRRTSAWWMDTFEDAPIRHGPTAQRTESPRHVRRLHLLRRRWSHVTTEQLSAGAA